VSSEPTHDHDPASDPPRREAEWQKPLSLDSLGLSPWAKYAVAALFGAATLGGGAGLGTATRRRPGQRPGVPRRRIISRKRDWLIAIVLWGSVAVIIVGGRLWAGSWSSAARDEGIAVLLLAGLFAICSVPVLAMRLVRAKRHPGE
jgi:hypothetical protein